MPVRNKVCHNNAPLGIENAIDSLWDVAQVNNGAKLLVMPLEQFFQRFLLFNCNNAVLLLIGIDAPAEHQFNDITDATVVAVSNSTNLVNEFFVTDGIETHPVCLGSCNVTIR